MTRLKDIPIKDRLLAKINIQSNGCWLWKGSIQGDGRYGTFKFNGKYSNPQRASYSLFKGEIPKDFVIINLCNNTLCANPDHLRAISKQEHFKRFKQLRKIKTEINSQNDIFNWKKLHNQLQTIYL